MSSAIFCDFFKFTLPHKENSRFRDELSIFLSQTVFEKANDDLYRIHNGTIKLGRRGQVVTVGVSGHSMSYLRDLGVLESFLALIFDFEHRVTLIDATCDFVGSVNSGSEVRRIYSEASKGLHRLTRKALAPKKHVRCLFSPGDDGKDTGTVYLGSRKNSEVYCKIYDKRKEHFDKTGVDLGQEVLRYELSVTGKLNPTLKDVWDPSNLFWRFMGCTLLPFPKDKSWVGYSEGYVLPARVPIEPYQALVYKLENKSSELREIARLAALGGDVGCARLIKEIQMLCDVELNSLGSNVVPFALKQGR